MTPPLAAGRARARGLPTRGTTAPQRLRRVDRWLLGTQARVLRGGPAPLVVDLGYGASPVTTVELAARLRALRPDATVVGVESDRDRVRAAQQWLTAHADDPEWHTTLAGVSFVHGSFDAAGLHPTVIRAMNVLRQYPPADVASAWATMTAALAPGGLVLDGTCDEIGRRASWITLDAHGPQTLTLAAHLPSLPTPSALAERLPKALIHRNVAGEAIHELLAAADRAWAAAAPHASFGPRARFVATATRLRDDGFPLVGGPQRWRLGELTVRWPAVAPTAMGEFRR